LAVAFLSRNNMEIPGPSGSKNTSQRMFIGSDKISEIINDSDSDGGSVSELSDSDKCEVNSPFSSSGSGSSNSKEEEVIQPEPGRGRKRTRRALPNKFSGVPGINTNFNITQDSSPWNIFEIFFSPEMFKHMQKETTNMPCIK
jgi:hypothetical protein